MSEKDSFDGEEGQWWREMEAFRLHFGSVGNSSLGSGKETTRVNSGEGDMNKLQWITKLGLCQPDHVTCLEFSVMVSFLFSGYISQSSFLKGLLASDMLRIIKKRQLEPWGDCIPVCV